MQRNLSLIRKSLPKRKLINVEYKNQLVTKQEKGYVIEGTDEVLPCYCFLFGKDKEVIAHGKESDLKNHRKTILLKGGPFLGMLKALHSPSIND